MSERPPCKCHGSWPRHADDQAAVLREQGLALDAARPVLEYVSRGRGYVDVTPYPDYTARRALGLMHAPTDSETKGETEGHR